MLGAVWPSRHSVSWTSPARSWATAPALRRLEGSPPPWHPAETPMKMSQGGREGRAKRPVP